MENLSHLMSIWDYASKYGELIDYYSFKYVYVGQKMTSLHLLALNGRYKTIKDILTYMEKKPFKRTYQNYKCYYHIWKHSSALCC
jgi:hypothetical protein